MTLRLLNGKFREGHRIFEQFLLEETGVRFTGWEHPYLRENETNYKRGAWVDGREELNLGNWDTWINREPEKILSSTYQACSRKVSRNLVISRSDRDDALSPFEDAIKLGPPIAEELANHLHAFFCNPRQEAFSARFDQLVAFLSDTEGLACYWSLVAYLAFLVDDSRFFPLRPSYFQKLARFYGNPDFILTSKVSWARYSAILGLAEQLRDRLHPRYPRPSMVEVQSYMWVIASRLKKEWHPPADLDGSDEEELSLEERLRRRLEAAEHRERVGVHGERHVVERERKRLKEEGYAELAKQVRHVADDEPDAGYDVLSFASDGKQKFLEVKSTDASRGGELGFTLTANQRQKARESGEQWAVVRVWNVLSRPSCQTLGNVVQNTTEGWILEPATWRCLRTLRPNSSSSPS